MALYGTVSPFWDPGIPIDHFRKVPYWELRFCWELVGTKFGEQTEKLGDSPNQPLDQWDYTLW